MDLRSALASKRGNETHFDLLISDPTDAEASLSQAEAALRLATIRDKDVEAARASAEQARAEMAGCFYRLTFRNLSPHEFEALVGAHEASAEAAAEGEVWDREGLTPALLAACTVDSDLSVEDWAAELASDRWSAADKLAVYRAVLDANIKQRSASLPKG